MSDERIITAATVTSGEKGRWASVERACGAKQKKRNGSEHCHW